MTVITEYLRNIRKKLKRKKKITIVLLPTEKSFLILGIFTFILFYMPVFFWGGCVLFCFYIIVIILCLRFGMLIFKLIVI